VPAVALLGNNQLLPHDWRPVGLEEVARDYVMASQREAHGTTLGDAARDGGALPEIELF
jgi:hypothetical protein